MALKAPRRFPVPVSDPEAVPVSDAHLRTITRTPPHDLTVQELLGGTYTLVKRLYGGSVDHITVQDDVTVDVTFADRNGLRVELLADGSALTTDDVEMFLQLYEDTQILLVFAGPVTEAARQFCLADPRIDYAALTISRGIADSQVVDWLNSNITVEEPASPPVQQ